MFDKLQSPLYPFVRGDEQSWETGPWHPTPDPWFLLHCQHTDFRILQFAFSFVEP